MDRIDVQTFYLFIYLCMHLVIYFLSATCTGSKGVFFFFFSVTDYSSDAHRESRCSELTANLTAWQLLVFILL